jgi:hypothetical protein
MPAPVSPAQAILDTIPAGVAAERGTGLLPGIEAGHRYSYRCGSRMGVAYAQADGSWTLKPGGITADWLTRNAAAADFVHAVYECAGCGR